MKLWKIHHQAPHEIDWINDQFLGLEPQLLIMNKMVSDKDIYLHVSGVTTWVINIYSLAIVYQIHKLDSPICGGFLA